MIKNQMQFTASRSTPEQVNRPFRVRMIELTFLLLTAVIPTHGNGQDAIATDNAPRNTTDNDDNDDNASRSATSHVDPSQLQFSRWSGELNVPDPVAIAFDHNGTAYVTQTQRRKSQDLDIRNNRDWVPDDVGLQSVEDKRRFFHEQISPDGDQARNRQRVDDWNEDGSHDWRDLTVISEKIHWLRDTDGDGTADSMGLFAEDFRTEVTGIAAGVLWHENDVFTTIAPDVWRLQDTNGDGTADEREVIATGFGLHIAYAGHDMHGLTVGPDGRLYWSIGDKGISVTNREGKQFHFPNQGGVMRCDFDGSNFEVFAHGLRNVQELAFDSYGNLFGVDNDSDQPDEKERFVYIVRDMDAGWRCNYQYRGEGFNPWTAERLWVPHFDGQASYILPPIQNYIDGPAGFAFNPGTALSSDYLNHFFLTGAPGGYQYAFKTRPVGASFEMEGEHLIGKGVPLVGIQFGPDGSLYGVDWGGGYPLNQTGAVWKIDVPESDLGELRGEVRTALSRGFSDRSDDELVNLLAHQDQRLRLGSQFELVKREATQRLIQSLESKSEMQQIHCIWGLGQLARAGNDNAKTALVEMLAATNPELRAQTARTISDVTNIRPSHLMPLLEDANPRVVFMACLALSKHPTSKALPILLRRSNAIEESNRYERFAISRALAACGTSEQLVGAAKQASLIGNLNLCVALRAKEDRQALSFFLHAESEQVATEAARGIHDDRSETEDLTALASVIVDTPHQLRPFLLRSLNANYRIGDRAAAKRVLQFAEDSSRDSAHRIEALSMLQTWIEPELLDNVDGRRRDLKSREIDLENAEQSLSRLAADPHPSIQAAAVRAARQLNVRLSEDALRKLTESNEIDTELRVEAVRSLAKQAPEVFASIMSGLLTDKRSSMRMATAELLVDSNPDAATDYLVSKTSAESSLDERQHAIGQLAHLDNEVAQQQLETLLTSLSDGKLKSEVALDVLEAAARQSESNPRLQTLLSKASDSCEETSKIEDKSLRRFGVCRDGGNKIAGKKLFETHLGAQCARCHRVGKKGSDVGPTLQGIATKRDRDALLRSIISPSKEIDKKYQTQSFLMYSGEVFQGVVKKEDDATTVIVDNQGKETRLQNDDIELVKKNTVSIMPEMIEVLSRRELRDLVAYLSSLRETQESLKAQRGTE